MKEPATNEPGCSGVQRGTIATYWGVEFAPLDPDPQKIYLEDIAHALALVCRFNGHTVSGPYSVAEHSVRVSQVLEHLARLDGRPGWEVQLLARWGLLHDASEAYIADICRPIKRGFANYKEVELRLQAAIAERFQLGLPEPEEVRWVDAAILRAEQRSLMRQCPWWTFPPDHPDLPGYRIKPWKWVEAKNRFLNRAHEVLPVALRKTVGRPG